MPKSVQTTTQLQSFHMLKIRQARLQQYMNQELPDVQTGFRKGRGAKDQIANIQLIGKDPNTGKDEVRKRGTTEDQMVGWHHWLNRHKFEQTPGDGDGQESLVCCRQRGWTGSDISQTWLGKWITNNSFLFFLWCKYEIILHTSRNIKNWFKEKDIMSQLMF